MIGTCAVLFGGSAVGESPVFADETPITHTVEQAKEESRQWRKNRIKL